MKAVVVLAIVVALFIGIPFCALAQEEPRGTSASCKRYAERFPEYFADYYKNLGECVSYIQACSTPKDDPALCLCRLMRMSYPQAFEVRFGTQGLGPCVSFFHTEASY